MPSVEAPLLSRRNFLLGSGLILSSQTSQWTTMENLITTVTKGVDITRALADPSVRNLLLPPSYENLPVTRTTTFYTPEAFENTVIIGYGDSLADGYMDKTDTLFAPGKYVAEMVQTHFGKNWHYVSHARNGSTADYVTYIMEESKLEDAKDMQADIILSAGANNMRVAIEKVWEKAEKVLQDPSDGSSLITFARGIHEGIKTYEIQMVELLQRLQQYKHEGRKINRVFVEGIPDMANAQAIFLPDRDPIQVDGFMLKRIAKNISRLVNAATIQAIQQVDAKEFDVIFKDNASVVTAGNITLMHPNSEGYKAMGNLQLQKSVAQFPDGKRSFWDKMAA